MLLCRGSGLQSVGGLTRGQMSGLVLCWVNQLSISGACGSSGRQGHKQKLRLLKKNIHSGTALCITRWLSFGGVLGKRCPSASDELHRDFSVEEQKPRVYHEPSFLSRACPFLPPEWFLSHCLEFLRT